MGEGGLAVDVISISAMIRPCILSSRKTHSVGHNGPGVTVSSQQQGQGSKSWAEGGKSGEGPAPQTTKPPQISPQQVVIPLPTSPHSIPCPTALLPSITQGTYCLSS